jgi:hypothetical protein
MRIDSPRGNAGDFVTVAAVAGALGIRRGKVLGWIARGELAAVNVADKALGRPRWRIARHALDSFFASRSNQNPNRPDDRNAGSWQNRLIQILCGISNPNRASHIMQDTNVAAGIFKMSSLSHNAARQKIAVEIEACGRQRAARAGKAGAAR